MGEIRSRILEPAGILDVTQRFTKVDVTTFDYNIYTISTINYAEYVIQEPWLFVNILNTPADDFNTIIFLPVPAVDGDHIIIKNLSDVQQTITVQSQSSGTYIDLPPVLTFELNYLDAVHMIYFNNRWYRFAEFKDQVLFQLSVNFIDTEQFIYVAPEPFRLLTVNNPSLLGLTILVNALPYTFGNPINLYDVLTVDVTAPGFIQLNCTRAN
jgi:hypothetical protein